MQEGAAGESAGRGGGEWRRGLALLVVSSALSLAALEGAVRVLGLATPQERTLGRAVNPQGTVGLDLYPDNPGGYFDIDLRDPATRARYEALGVGNLPRDPARAPWAVEERYNSQGFRDVEPPPRRPGVTRVVVIGDSFTEGQGVREADTYPRVLERLLDAQEPGRWEVRNCAHRGWDFPKLFEVARDQVAALQPDVVVYGMVLNDPVQSPAFAARQKYLDDWILDRRRIAGQPGAEAAPSPSRLWQLLHDRWVTWRVARETTRWYLDMYGPGNHDGWEETRDLMRRMGRVSRQGHARLLVALWPLLVGTDRDYPFAPAVTAITQACAAAGLPFLDLRPGLTGHPMRELWVSEVDRHPNALAHRLAAERLRPVVRALSARQGPADQEDAGR